MIHFQMLKKGVIKSRYKISWINWIFNFNIINCTNLSFYIKNYKLNK